MRLKKTVKTWLVIMICLGVSLILFYIAILNMESYTSVKVDTIDHLFDASNINKRSFTIVGAMSFEGARIASNLHTRGHNVIPVEDAINIEPDPMRWYRVTQLTSQGLPTTFVDFSNSNFEKLEKILQEYDSNTIVYIPTGIIEMKKLQDPHKIHQLGAQSVAHFQKLLSTVTGLSSIRQVVLLSSISDDDIIHRAWLSTLEQLLLSFYKQFSLNIALIKVSGVYGPWQDSAQKYCWYVDDLTQLILEPAGAGLVMKDFFGRCDNHSQSRLHATEEWIQEYKENLKKQKRNVIVGATLDIENVQARFGTRHPSMNDHKYFQAFVLTAIRYPVDIIIIHNTLSEAFIQNYRKFCHSCHFIRYSRVNERIAHDQRFYMLYDFLLKHSDVSNLLSADIRDVIFPGDPFKKMASLGDYFFTYLDYPFNDYLKDFQYLTRMFRNCYPNFKYEQEVFNLYGIFNNGVMGGSRHVMLSLLSRMILYLDTARLEEVCDMMTVEIVLHLHYYDRVQAGFPFTGSFMIGIPGPYGIAVKHKPFAYRYESPDYKFIGCCLFVLIVIIVFLLIVWKS